MQKFQDLVRRTSSSPSSLSLVQLGCEKWYLGTSRPGGHCEDGRLGSPTSSEHPSCSSLVVSCLLGHLAAVTAPPLSRPSRPSSWVGRGLWPLRGSALPCLVCLQLLPVSPLAGAASSLPGDRSVPDPPVAPAEHRLGPLSASIALGSASAPSQGWNLGAGRASPGRLGPGNPTEPLQRCARGPEMFRL